MEKQIINEWTEKDMKKFFNAIDRVDEHHKRKKTPIKKLKAMGLIQ